MEQGFFLNLDPAKLLTKEEIVIGAHLQEVNSSQPVTVVMGADHSFVIQDGNHRAVKALKESRLVPVELVGFLNQKVKKDPYYHSVEKVRLV